MRPLGQLVKRRMLDWTPARQIGQLAGCALSRSSAQAAHTQRCRHGRRALSLGASRQTTQDAPSSAFAAALSAAASAAAREI